MQCEVGILKICLGNRGEKLAPVGICKEVSVRIVIPQVIAVVLPGACDEMVFPVF